jgi:hypothetical protein
VGRRRATSRWRPPTANGEIYCIAVNIDEGGGGNYRYGTQDAAAPKECREGWG